MLEVIISFSVFKGKCHMLIPKNFFSVWKIVGAYFGLSVCDALLAIVSLNCYLPVAILVMISYCVCPGLFLKCMNKWKSIENFLPCARFKVLSSMYLMGILYSWLVLWYTWPGSGVQLLLFLLLQFHYIGRGSNADSPVLSQPLKW